MKKKLINSYEILVNDTPEFTNEYGYDIAKISEYDNGDVEYLVGPWTRDANQHDNSVSKMGMLTRGRFEELLPNMTHIN